jgi:oligopeptide transport system substrate-binding protein
MKRIFYFLIAVLGVFGGLFCVLGFSKNRSDQMKDVAHLRVNLSEGDPPSLHPHMGADIRGRILGKSLFEGLTRLAENGKGELAAASKVEISPSGTQYTFTIRPQLWSNGELVTAQNFEKAWKQALDPNSLCARSDLFYIIKNAKKARRGEVSTDEVGVKAIDDMTLFVELEHPAPYFLQLISHPIFSPLNREEKEPTVFNGPFRMGTWKRGTVIELVKNPTYWDAEHVQLQKVSISMVADPYTLFSLFEKGEFDILGDTFDTIPLDILPTVMQDHRFKTQEISKVYWLYINTTHPPFQSAKIRKALSYALDRKYLTEHFLIGDHPCSTVLPRTLSLLKENPEIDGNVQKARQLFEEGLKELGLTRETFPPIVLSYCMYGSQKSLSEFLQETLQKNLGIEVRLENYEWNVLQDHLIHGQFQLASCVRNALYEDPFYFLEIFKEKKYSYNYTGWENETYKQFLSLAASSPSVSEREQYLRQAEELLMDQMPVIPIYTDTCKYLPQDRVKGYRVNRSGYTDFKNISVTD